MKQSEKCLTLHLYRKDEVLAAMRWAIITNNLLESIYWGLELFDSDMEQDALQMLEFIWLSQIGFSSFSFLRRILDIYKTGELDRDSWISLLNSMARMKSRDSTAFYLLIRGATEPCDWTPSFKHTYTYNTLSDALTDTIQRGKVLEAWLISRAMKPDEQWIILKSLAIQKGRSESLCEVQMTTLSEYEQRAAAFVLLGLTDEQWKKVFEPLIEYELPSEIIKAIDEWDSEESIRLRRVYKIKPEALLYITERSVQSVLESSEKDIQGDFLESLIDSPYWSNILKGYINSRNEWISDRYNEMFYDTYFPYKMGDTPDEWVTADREKSHGRGLGRSEEAGLKRFLDTLLQRSMSLGVWNCIKPEEYMDSLDWLSIYSELHSKCLKNLTSQLPFNATTKTFEIY